MAQPCIARWVKQTTHRVRRKSIRRFCCAKIARARSPIVGLHVGKHSTKHAQCRLHRDTRSAIRFHHRSVPSMPAHSPVTAHSAESTHRFLVGLTNCSHLPQHFSRYCAHCVTPRRITGQHHVDLQFTLFEALARIPLCFTPPPAPPTIAHRVWLAQRYCVAVFSDCRGVYWCGNAVCRRTSTPLAAT